jgi:hypothetical protein
MLSQPRPAVPQVVVPIRRLDRAALRALAYARSISRDVTAVCLASDEDADAIAKAIRRRAADVAVATAHRGLARYLDDRERADPERPIAVVISDVVARRRWSYVLDGEALLKLRLLVRPNTVVVDVPYHV